MNRALFFPLRESRGALSLRHSLLLILMLGVLASGCVSVPDEELVANSVGDGDVQMTREQIITAGLAQGREQLRGSTPLRPFATVYSTVGGLRPVKFNDKERQVSDSDSDLLLESIEALSRSSDLQAFAVYGVAQDEAGQRWFAVHFEERSGRAELRQYPLPPPKNVTQWRPAAVEDVRSVVFTRQ